MGEVGVVWVEVESYGEDEDKIDGVWLDVEEFIWYVEDRLDVFDFGFVEVVVLDDVRVVVLWYG